MQFPSALGRITRVNSLLEIKILLKRNAFDAVRTDRSHGIFFALKRSLWIGFVSIAGSRSLVTPIG